MNSKCICYVISLTINLLFAPGCKRDEFNWGEKIGDLTYSGNVVFIGSEELALLKEINSSRMVFTNKTPGMEKISNMSILVAGVSEKTPFGSLRKVNSIQNNGSEIILYTSEANLADAIKEGTIRFHAQLLEKDFELKSKVDGVLVTVADKSFDGLAVTLDDLEIFGNGTMNARLDGAIGISTEIDITIRIESNKITEVIASATLNKIDEITVTSNGGFNGKEEITAAEFIHSPVIIDSIVFVPYVGITCGFDGTVAGKVYSGVRQDRLITSGLKFNRSAWSEDPLKQTSSFDFVNPVINDNADLEIFSGPEINILLFGKPVQKLKANGFQKIEAHKTGSPLWKLSIGNEGYNTVKADILGLTDDHTIDLGIQLSEIGSSNTN